MKKIQNVELLTLQLPPYYEEDNPPLGRAETNNRWLDHKCNQNVGLITNVTKMLAYLLYNSLLIMKKIILL
jgi:hypothetical protein